MSERICARCVMDTTDPDIVFDENGICNHCRQAEQMLVEIEKHKCEKDAIIQKIKACGKGKSYDCLIGISGGVDSSYIAYLVKELGLRPLAVHFDNGWNSELAVANIHNLLEQLDIPLYTYVLDWNEFRDLQMAFLRASTPDCEVPTDHMIFATLTAAAVKFHIKNIINGQNTTSESILPKRWSYGHADWRYIKDIHRRFGSRRLKSFLHYSFLDDVYFTKVKKLQIINILDYIDYDKENAKKMLMDRFGWKDYGGKHFESFYTRFYQSYILNKKFGIDKRKMHLSSLIVAGQITRTEALRQLEEAPYDEQTIGRDIEYFKEKMELSDGEYEEIMNAPVKSYLEYKYFDNGFWGKLMKTFGGQ